MALSEVPDPVFASGVVGGGCALIPDSASECLTVHSPINGVVTKLKPHAAIITSTQGVSILIHLGIDTVSLHGKGFAALVDEGDVVAAGAPLIHWDLTPVRDAGLSPCAPIVVIGTTHDPATPYSMAQGLSGQLSSGVLVTVEGWNHTAYRRGADQCVVRAVEDYLVKGNVPQNGLTCQ